jgi:hypothetical protein
MNPTKFQTAHSTAGRHWTSLLIALGLSVTCLAAGQTVKNEERPFVAKTVHIPAPDAKTSIIRIDSTYVGHGDALLQDFVTLVASDTFGAFYQRRSEDNGRTWMEPTLLFSPTKTTGGTERRGEGAFIFDEGKGRVIRIYNHHIYPRDTYTREVMGTTTIRYEISTDEGKTFAPPQQLIVKGGTKSQWAPGVTYGKNCMMISFSEPFIDRKGRIVLPAQRFQIVPESVSPFRTPLEAACLIGEWIPGGDIGWTIGNTVTIDLALSSRGIFEPAVAELPDGALVMICRGSNANLGDVPGRKWLSRSMDGARTWSKPTPLGFEDGTLFHSPSTGSRLIRSAKTGKLHWIGNISPVNPLGNSPRHPLQIAEFDERRLCLLRNTVRVIDQRTESDTENLQLSNFRVYEDRRSGEFVLTMARLSEGTPPKSASPAYEYRIDPLALPRG